MDHPEVCIHSALLRQNSEKRNPNSRRLQLLRLCRKPKVSRQLA